MFSWREVASRWTPALGLILCSSCVRVTWTHSVVNREFSETDHSALVVGKSDLDKCLACLRAPLYVWEESDGGMALAWGWSEEKGWGLNVGIPILQLISAVGDYGDVDRHLLGLVLVFDADQRLISKRQGHLAELAADRPRRPSRRDTAQPASSATEG